MHPEVLARPAVLRVIAVVMFFAALSVVSTYPLIWHLNSALPGAGFGDNLASLWNVWWFHHALQERLPLYRTDLLFAPVGTQLALHTHATTHSLIAWPLTGVLPIAGAHNVATLIGLTLNGWLTYLLARRYSRDVLPAVAAGIVFSWSAFVHVHLLGHLNLVHAWVVPLFVLAFLRLEAAPGLRRSALLGAAAAVVFYTDYYFVVFCAGIVAVWWTTRMWSIRARLCGRYSSGLVSTIVLVLIGADLIVIAIIAITGGSSLELAGLKISLRGLRNPLTALWGLLLIWLLTRYSVSSASAAESGPSSSNAAGVWSRRALRSCSPCRS